VTTPDDYEGNELPTCQPIESAQKKIDASQLRDLKILLDENVITQEEFDAKKGILGVIENPQKK